MLVLSSWVAHGHVGLSAATPMLQTLGHSVTGLPTTILSNHPGWAQTAAAPVTPHQLQQMADALDANGWLAPMHSLQTGYLPTAAHVRFACDLVERLPKARIVVDPVLGDDPDGLYMPQDTAEALRDALLPRAQVLTPNRFELKWLTGKPADTLDQTRAAAESLLDRVDEVLVTSPPIDPFETGILRVNGGGATLFRTAHYAGIPHGTGDAFAALIAAGLTPGATLGHLHALARESRGAQHLHIAESAAQWTVAGPIQPTEPPWPLTSS